MRTTSASTLATTDKPGLDVLLLYFDVARVVRFPAGFTDMLEAGGAVPAAFAACVACLLWADIRFMLFFWDPIT
jgi:hypothetical protein